MVDDLVSAIDRRDIAAVAAILKSAPSLVLTPVAAEGDQQQSLLHRAIPSDGVRLTPEHIAVVRTLLDHGATVDAVGWGSNNGLCTPLTMAAWGGHTPIVDILLAAGAHPNGAPGAGRAPPTAD